MEDQRRVPAPEVGSLSRARARSARRILDATRLIVERDGIDGLSMRPLADEAGVSVRTIYNVFGDRQAVIVALVQQTFEAMDAELAASAAADPIERIWETVAVSLDAYRRHVPKTIVAAVITDRSLNAAVAPQWSGRELIVGAVEAAVRAGSLHGDVPAERIIDHAGPVHAHRLLQWARGEIDDDALRAGVLHAYDICLLAVARTRTRSRLLEHLATLEPLMPALIVGLDAPPATTEQRS